MRRHSCAAMGVDVDGLADDACRRRAQENEKHVFVTALDKDGTPIVGLTAEHFAIRESGRDRTVIKVEPLQIPMHVAVLVDTSIANGSPDETFRSAVVAFVERLAGHRTTSRCIRSATGRRGSPVSRRNPRRSGAAPGMFGWSHQRSHLIDAIDLACATSKVSSRRRPVIIAITSESPEASGQTAGGVIKRLIAQSVAFHAISLGAVWPPRRWGSDSGARSGAGKQQAPRRDGRGRRRGPRTQSGVAAGDVGDGRRAPASSQHARTGACAGPGGQRVVEQRSR